MMNFSFPATLFAEDLMKRANPDGIEYDSIDGDEASGNDDNEGMFRIFWNTPFHQNISVHIIFPFRRGYLQSRQKRADRLPPKAHPSRTNKSPTKRNALACDPTWSKFFF